MVQIIFQSRLTFVWNTLDQYKFNIIAIEVLLPEVPAS